MTPEEFRKWLDEWKYEWDVYSAVEAHRDEEDTRPSWTAGDEVTRTRERDLEAFFYGPPLVPKPSIYHRFIEYFLMSLWNTAVVYALYTVYVFLWLRFDTEQYVRWLLGGIPMSLLTGGLIVRANVWAKQRWFPK